MNRLLIYVTISCALGAVALASACSGGSDTPKDFAAVYDEITFYPGSTLDGGPVAPAGLIEGDINAFRNDKRMFVAGSAVRQQQVLDYFAMEIPKLGWSKEDPPKPKAEEMQHYCGQKVFFICLSFTKDDIRLIVSAPLQLQLNPVATQGVSYHIHLEDA